MHTVELLEAATALAHQLGFKIREEWLDGASGGSCEIRGQKWLFLDPDASSADQLDTVIEALRLDPAIHQAQVPWELQRLLDVRKSA